MIGLPQTAPAQRRSLIALATLSAATVGLASSFSVALAAKDAKDAKPTAAAPVKPAAAPAAVPAVAPPPAPTPEQVAAAAAQRKADIETAKARCTAVLKTITAVTIAHDPIEEGDCGALAPVELVSVGKNPEVALSPPVIVNCDLAVALHDWMKTDVQPLAKQHLGKPVVRIETMSSYSCRNAYGRKMSKLSEHGKANAVDIRGFVTASGQTAYVLSDWGMTSGEIRAAAAAAAKEQAARELAAAEAKAAADAQAKAVAAAKAGSGSGGKVPNPIANAGTLIEGIAKPGLSGGDTKTSTTGLGFNQPSRLGGPKPASEGRKPANPTYAAAPQGAALDPNTANATSLFLRAVHDSACKRFATTLGPETNAAHRNHFHVDLAERATKKTICE